MLGEGTGKIPVALLAEGVDRNAAVNAYRRGGMESPSSRRAWIEIYFARYLLCPVSVALLAEGVDRNSLVLWVTSVALRSPSSRRAWIEIGRGRVSGHRKHVALLAEGVDRNLHRLISRR